MTMNQVQQFCSGCTTELTYGKGQFFYVHINAFQDPSGPQDEYMKSLDEIRHEMSAILRRLNTQSTREIEGQVHRSLILTMCNLCFNKWIENPIESNAG